MNKNVWSPHPPRFRRAPLVPSTSDGIFCYTDERLISVAPVAPVAPAQSGPDSEPIRCQIPRERSPFSLMKDMEEQMVYNCMIDNMPIWSGMPSLTEEQLQEIKDRALTFPGKDKVKEETIEKLLKEVKLEYDRATNKMIFDHVVKTYPDEFSHIALPKSEPVVVPQFGCVQVPSYDYEARRARLAAKLKFKPALPE